MNRSQRYRLTLEFELRDRSDYATIRAKFQSLSDSLNTNYAPSFQSDFLSIEKIEDPSQ